MPTLAVGPEGVVGVAVRATGRSFLLTGRLKEAAMQIRITQDGVTCDGGSYETGDIAEIRHPKAIRLIQQGCAEAIKTIGGPPDEDEFKAEDGPPKHKAVKKAPAKKGGE